MHVGRRYMRVGDDGMASVDAAVIEIKEPFRLSITHHVAEVLIGAAHLDLPGLRFRIGRLQGLLAVFGSIPGDGRFQRRQILTASSTIWSKISW